MKVSLSPSDTIEDHDWKNFATSTKKTMNHTIHTKEFTEKKKGKEKKKKDFKVVLD